MKKRVLFFLACSLALITIQAENIRCIHENVRETPYPATGTHFIYKPFTTAGSQKYQASGLFTIQSLAEQRLLGRKHHTVPTQALVLVQSAQSIGKRYMVLACAFSKQRRKRVSLEQDIQFYRNRRHTPIRHTRSQCFFE